MSHSIQRLLRTPWGFPLVVALAVVGMVTNEAMHVRSLEGMRASADADEVNRYAALAHYSALDRANSLRAHLLGPSERWITRHEGATADLGKSLDSITRYLNGADGGGSDLSRRVFAVVTQRNVDIQKAWELAMAGHRAESLQVLADSDAAGRGTALRDSLLEVMAFARVDREKIDARQWKTLEVFRWVVHGLIAAMLLAAYALLRQMGVLDAERQQQAQHLADQVALRTAELRELAGHLISTREDERSRLARELHDEMGGLLSSIKLDLARIRRHAELPPAVREHTMEMDRRVSEVVDLKRRVIESLRPSVLDHLGLAQALTLLCQDHARTMQVPTHEDIEPVELARELELTIYRLVQEALTNARKYSRASEMWVSLRTQGGQVRASVEDNGTGFDPRATGVGRHGIAGMRPRVESQGGRLDIVSPRVDGPGTQVLATMPLRPRVSEGAVAATAVDGGGPVGAR